jgi:hypothetical protein
MFAIKSFDFYEKRMNIPNLQTLWMTGISPLPHIQNTMFFKKSFSGSLPNALITVQSGDGTIYATNIVFLNRFSITFNLYPVYTPAPKYKFFKIQFLKTIAMNDIQAADTKMGLGRLRLYNGAGNNIPLLPSMISVGQPDDPTFNSASLVNVTSDPLQAFVYYVGDFASFVKISFPQPTSVSHYEFINLAYPNTQACLHNTQPSSWKISASVDGISYSIIHSVDRWRTTIDCSQSSSMFQLPCPPSTATVDIHILASNI